MLVDAAKYGDVEIPVFCYEPKLGQPVGACRMCLVEIEGIPKLQTGCSTPVKDGMVVHTQTQRVHDAQRAVVEFLLINHPLDCPVCDKGGECPLQDITYGWGPGTSRFIEPKRHFRKPLELSPLIAIDRERCILCYRCVRFSQEISEDYQLILSERGAHSYVSTFDGHPYVGPFSGNIIELCPVGALTSTAYRFRARPWDIEGAGTVCTYCPSQCNVELTVRDDRVMRVLARDHAEVDDGWLCDKGRFAYQSTHVDERITAAARARGHAADARELGEGARRRRDRAQEGRAEGRRARGRRHDQRGGLPPGAAVPRRPGLRHCSPARPRARCPPTSRARSPTRRCRPPCPTSSSRTPCSCSTATRSTTRRSSTCACARASAATACKLAVASARPGALDPNAASVLRTAPGAGEALLVGLDAALSGDDGNLGGAATAAGSNAQAVRDLAAFLSGAGDDVVILYSERLLTGARGASAAQALLNVAARLGARRPRRAPGLLEIPSSTNGRGIREAGFAPLPRPGLRRRRRARPPTWPTPRPSVLYLLHADPVRTHADRAYWETALGGRADRDRARVDAHRRARGARRRRLPRRGLRGEGGHAHAPRRPRPAPAPRDRPPRRARRGRARGLAGHRRGRAPRGPRHRRARRADGLQAALRRRALLRRAHARRDRRPRRALAGDRGGRGGRARRVGAGGPLRPARRRRRRARRAAPRHLAARCGPRPRSTSRPRCASCARARSSSSRRWTRSASASATATRSRSAPTAPACAARRACAPSVPGGSVFLVAGTHEEPANALGEPLVAVRRVGGDAEQDAPPPRRSRRRRARATPRRRRAPRSTCRRATSDARPDPRTVPRRDRLRGGRLLRGVVDPAAQGAGDLRRRLPARPGRAARRAQDPRPLPAPLRPEPRRPLRRAAADGRHRQAALQAGLPPVGLRRLDVRARARDLDVHGVRDARARPVLATPSTSSARRSGSTGSTRASASSTPSRSAGSPSTG